MKLFQRVSDLLRANVSEMLDKAEDPEKMIKLYLEDAKNQLSAMTSAVAESIGTEKVLQKQYDGLKEEQTHWEQNATAALAANREDLATKALEQQQKIEDRMQKLTGPLADAKAQTEKMKSDLNDLKERVEDTEANSAILISRAKAAKAREHSAEVISKISGSGPLDEMKSMEEKINATEAHAEALKGLSGSHQENLEKEFQGLSSGKNVADKLAALKLKMQK
jgi:phage shock protein A